MSIIQNLSSNQSVFQTAINLPHDQLIAIHHIIIEALIQQQHHRSNGGRNAHLPPPPYHTNSETALFRPRMDMFETPSADGGPPLVTATFELPGLRKEDVHIQVIEKHMVVTGDRNRLTAVEPSTTTDKDAVMKDNSQTEKLEEGEISVPRAGYTVREIKRGKFKRVVPLPEETKLEDIKASMHDGILTVTFPGKMRPIPQYVPVA